MRARLRLVAALAGGAAAGALLTALTSLFTGWLSRRHDQRRWLLDRRMEAYLALNAEISHWTGDGVSAPGRDSVRQLGRLMEQEDRVSLVAPARTVDAVQAAVGKVFDAERVITSDPDGDDVSSDEPREALLAVSRAMGYLIRAQRQDLQGVDPRWRRWLRQRKGHTDTSARQ
jgi:hypothetical protein